MLLGAAESTSLTPGLGVHAAVHFGRQSKGGGLLEKCGFACHSKSIATADGKAVGMWLEMRRSLQA